MIHPSDPIELLTEEHRVILSVLDRLDEWAHDAHQQLTPGRLEEICDFLSGFVDPVHQTKEELLLMPALISCGFSGTHGPLAAILQEHEQGCRLLGELARQAASKEPWSRQETAAARSNAHDYAALLRQHIHKEDLALFDSARTWLPTSELNELGERMVAFHDGEDARSREHLLARAARLTRSILP